MKISIITVANLEKLFTSKHYFVRNSRYAFSPATNKSRAPKNAVPKVTPPYLLLPDYVKYGCW